MANPQQPASQSNANVMNQSFHSDLADPHRLSNAHPTDSPRSYALVQDLDIIRDNPVEAKHRRLVRSHRNGPLDRDLKPNPKIRDELNVSISWVV